MKRCNILTIVMLTGILCGCSNNDAKTELNTEVNDTEIAVIEDGIVSEENATEFAETAILYGQDPEASLSINLIYQFRDLLTADSSLTLNELASKLISNPLIEFNGELEEVKPGLLMGFGENEMKGFKSGVRFSPTISTIPFVGYVFEVKDEEAANSLQLELNSKADLNWNVCTSADQMVVDSVGNKVLFVMCAEIEKDDESTTEN